MQITLEEKRAKALNALKDAQELVNDKNLIKNILESIESSYMDVEVKEVGNKNIELSTTNSSYELFFMQELRFLIDALKAEGNV